MPAKADALDPNIPAMLESMKHTQQIMASILQMFVGMLAKTIAAVAQAAPSITYLID